MTDDPGGYELYRRNKIESGCCYQDFIADLFLREMGIPIATYTSQLYQVRTGESRQGFEIKHDEQYSRTGNLYIEIEEKARPRLGPYVPSGIFRSDNTWQYIIGNYDEVFVFSKKTLRALGLNHRTITNRTLTSRGFLLPRAEAAQFAELVIFPQAEHKIVKGSLDDLQRHGHELLRMLTTNPAQRTFWDAAEETMK